MAEAAQGCASQTGAQEGSPLAPLPLPRAHQAPTGAHSLRCLHMELRWVTTMHQGVAITAMSPCSSPGYRRRCQTSHEGGGMETTAEGGKGAE